MNIDVLPSLKKGFLSLMTALSAGGLLMFSPLAARAGEPMNIRLVVDGEPLPAIVEDNPAGRDFLKMLPLTLTLQDYNGTEKIGDLPHRLSTKGAPDGFEPAAGDLAFYAPWGNLALFYRDFSWSRALIRLGRITAGAEKLAAVRGDVSVTFERAE